MDPAPIRRWNPGFIAMRWRHLFWGLPLLGLLAGLAVHFLPMIRGTATGVVQFRTGSLPIGAADVVQATFHDNILGLTAQRTDLANRWKLKGKSDNICMDELRKSIIAKPIPGTALVEITVNGRSRAESEFIWLSLLNALEDYYKGLQNLQYRTRLDQLEAAVKTQKSEVDSKREALRHVIRTETLLYYPNGAVQQPGGQFTTLKADFESSQKQLEELQIEEILEKMQAKIMEDPLIIHQAPGTPAPLTLWDTLRPLVLHSSIGVGAGMVLAVVLAYLFELLFPRRAPTG